MLKFMLLVALVVAITAGSALGDFPSIPPSVRKIFTLGGSDAGQPAATTAAPSAHQLSGDSAGPALPGAVAPPTLLPAPTSTGQLRRLPAVEIAPEDIPLGTPHLPSPSGHISVDSSLCCPPCPCCPQSKSVAIETPTVAHAALPWGRDERVSLAVRDASIGTVLGMIAEQHNLNLITADQVIGNISLALNDIPLHQALDVILTANGYTWNVHQGILVVSSAMGDSRLSPIAQGRQLRVFELDFASAAEVHRIVEGLLSPVGKSFIRETDSQDQRKTREAVIVEDLPAYVARVEAYIAQADCAPRQVLIEANVLEVTLDNDLRHGVNLDQLLRLSDTRITFESTGFADDTASPAFFLGIDGTDLKGLVELLMTTTDAKNLASPNVLALNGQEARIQIGSQFGFFVTTTTQTSTLQSVEFIDVGVVLRVTPLISHDGRVLMTVKPEVSGGRINPITGLPEEDTTEVETTVMLNDGSAMVIGGLIQEEDTETQNKIPYLGDMWKIGRLFQRRNVVRKRSEIIITLVPHILPLAPPQQCRKEVNVARATTPLLHGPLRQVDRRAWEPILPDAIRNPINR